MSNIEIGGYRYELIGYGKVGRDRKDKWHTEWLVDFTTDGDLAVSQLAQLAVEKLRAMGAKKGMRWDVRRSDAYQRDYNGVVMIGTLIHVGEPQVCPIQNEVWDGAQ